ncbi:MAG: hypothetical protein AVDCRST_MAG64-847, partial [uncultured Phycisphaerae bacterium]
AEAAGAAVELGLQAVDERVVVLPRPAGQGGAGGGDPQPPADHVDERRGVLGPALVRHDPGEPGADAVLVGHAAGGGLEVQRVRERLDDRRVAGHQGAALEHLDDGVGGRGDPPGGPGPPAALHLCREGIGRVDRTHTRRAGML